VYLINLFVASAIVNICWIYIGNGFLNKNTVCKAKSIILPLIFGTIMLTIINIYFNSIFKIFMNYLLIGSIYKLVFKVDLGKALILSLIIVIYYFVAEIIFSLPLTIILNIFAIAASNNDFIFLFANIGITIIVLCLNRIEKINRNLRQIMTFPDLIKSQEQILAVVFAIAIFGRKNFDFVNLKVNYVMNLFLILIFFIMLYHLYREKQKSIAISEKYDHLLNYIQKYELELTQKSMTIHEFKNQIIAIKGFISKKNKNLNAYTENIISELKNLENNLLTDMEYLPKGGLKGLIYFKLGDLNNKGISVITKIDSKMRRSIFSKCDSILYNDILKIIGVHLDNAIEATSISSKKEIVLELYCNKKETHFILTNTHDNKIDESKIGAAGYSTKGKNRGYGLQLAEKIIEKHNNLKQVREIDDNYYTVHLIINKDPI
jgi:two-component system sensor histidine kinase AgrC